MKNSQPLKQILVATRPHWDRPEIRPAVRENFEKMINCRSPALGAAIFASENEEKLVYYTCKSRSCPSCGQRANLLWQREQWNALPDIPYVGMCFTMPRELWPIFRRNRHLLHDLPALAAAVIQQWARTRHRVRVLILVMPHTFGRHLRFQTTSSRHSFCRRSEGVGSPLDCCAALQPVQPHAYVALCRHHVSSSGPEERFACFGRKRREAQSRVENAI